jgi:ParB-like chromosome segregation protein Spo0J
MELNVMGTRTDAAFESVPDGQQRPDSSTVNDDAGDAPGTLAEVSEAHFRADDVENPAEVNASATEDEAVDEFENSEAEMGPAESLAHIAEAVQAVIAPVPGQVDKNVEQPETGDDSASKEDSRPHRRLGYTMKGHTVLKVKELQLYAEHDHREQNRHQKRMVKSKFGKNLEALGQLTPVFATKRNGKWVLVAGHRRVWAMDPDAEVNVIELEFDSFEDEVRFVVAENSQRQSFNSTAKLNALKEYKANGLSQAQFAEDIGCTQARVSQLNKELGRDQRIMAAIEKGRKFGKGHGRLLQEALDLDPTIDVDAWIKKVNTEFVTIAAFTGLLAIATAEARKGRDAELQAIADRKDATKILANAMDTGDISADDLKAFLASRRAQAVPTVTGVTAADIDPDSDPDTDK